MPKEIPRSAIRSPEDAADDIAAAFDEHGFCVFRGFLSHDEANTLLARADALASSLPERVAAGEIPPEHAQYDHADCPATLKQIQSLHECDSLFGSFMEQRLRPLCESILGEKVVSQNMQYFNKPPLQVYPEGSGSKETPPHQDGYYFMINPQIAVTMWLALEPADEENGCLRYVRGSRSRGMRPHDFSGVMGFSQRITDFDETCPSDTSEEIVMVAQPGDLIVHHCLMVHRALPNRSLTRHRRAIGAIFYGESAVRDEDAYAKRALEIRKRAAKLDGQSEASVGLQPKRPRPDSH
eukprot:TRINITY_DN68154_c0_g1_i1.p1 TRINITY_DN68154_c0_g1~~TRINITY_DN68154_c0_g1_i1.p1  ORF type:complete len:296 (+),score=34.12 TRINITY_DN68154_c0_g1_i1:65-952(+)